MGQLTPWETFHHTGGFSFANPDSVIENVRVSNYGDAINDGTARPTGPSRAAHTSMIHDDCLQDDYLNAGVIEDSLFDGCYVGISTRASSNNSSSDGHNNTLTMRNLLLRLQPMPTVYKGPAPGHGGFFKWDDEAHRSPKLALFDNVFRVDQLPNHGSLGLPDGYQVSCSGNTIVWLGRGSFPEAASWLAKCPDTRIVTTPRVDVGHRRHALGAPRTSDTTRPHGLRRSAALRRGSPRRSATARALACVHRSGAHA